MPDLRLSTPWVIVGCGRVGTLLARLAERLGIEVRATWRRAEPAEVSGADNLVGPLSGLEPYLPGAIAFITVTDAALEDVTRELASSLSRATSVLHCSGSLDSRLLREAGVTVPVASMHPLLSVADPAQALERVSECVWSVEGDEAAVGFARALLAAIDVDPIEIAPQAKILYHASAVASAGLLVGLMDAAFAIAAAAGIDDARARQMLLPLARSTIENLEAMGTREALTGPVARGDDVTIQKHLEAIEEAVGPDVAQIYRLLTKQMTDEA